MAREVSKWITVNGNHVPIYEGESKADVRKRIEQLGSKSESKKGSSKKSSAKSEEAAKKKESASSEPKDVFEAAKAMNKGDGTLSTKNKDIIKAYKSNGSYGVVEHPDGSATIMDKKSDAWKKHSEGSSEKETKIDGANTISKKDFVKKYAEEYGMDADDFKQKGKDIKNFIIPENEENPYIGVEYSDGTFWRYGTGRDLEVTKKELQDSLGKPTQQDKDERAKQKQIANANKQKDDLNKSMNSKEESVFTVAQDVKKEGKATTKNEDIVKSYKSNGSYAVVKNADGSYDIMDKGSDAWKEKRDSATQNSDGTWSTAEKSTSKKQSTEKSINDAINAPKNNAINPNRAKISREDINNAVIQVKGANKGDKFESTYRAGNGDMVTSTFEKTGDDEWTYVRKSKDGHVYAKEKVNTETAVTRVMSDNNADKRGLAPSEQSNYSFKTAKKAETAPAKKKDYSSDVYNAIGDVGFKLHMSGKGSTTEKQIEGFINNFFHPDRDRKSVDPKIYNALSDAVFKMVEAGSNPGNGNLEEEFKKQLKRFMKG